MTASVVLLLPIERLDHLEPVLGVDAEQLQHDEPQGAAFVGGAGLHLAPQIRVDIGQAELAHSGVILHKRFGACGASITSRSQVDHLCDLAGGAL